MYLKTAIPILALLLLVMGCTKKTIKPQAELQEVNGQKMLLGEVQYQDILHYFPAWQKVDQQDQVNPTEVKRLKQVQEPLAITCYMGTWCGDSREEVPPFIKAVETAQNKNIKVNLIGVDRKKMDPENTAIQYDVQRVPTFIIFKNGQEIGRMVEFPMKENFVEDFLDIVDAQ
jgi:thiol-disulfide isomerase/thioredoxin